MKKLKFVVITVFLSACSTTSHQSSGDDQTARQPDSAFATTEKMDIERMKQIAFESCQGSFKPPVILPVPELDPGDSVPNHIGMVYQEQQAVTSGWMMGQDGWYGVPRPRAQVNKIPMDVFVKAQNSDLYELKPWKIRRKGDPEGMDYTSPAIVPPIDADKLPPAARVITEVILGHQIPGSKSMPQMFSFRSSGYVRFSGYPPMTQGASFRLGANNIFGEGGGDKKPGENFPIIRSIFLSILNKDTAHAYLHLEGKTFCTAMSLEMTPGASSEIVVDSYWYTRQDFDWKRSPHTGLVAYSSMVYKTAADTLNVATDEAHDSDRFRFKFRRQGHLEERQKVFILGSPKNKHALRIKDLRSETAISLKVREDEIEPTEWILANEDRNPEHYKDFEAALGSTNYQTRASYKVRILESNVKTGVSLYVSKPDGEYGDNIVGVSTIRQDIKKARSPDEAVHFKYKTTAFYPN